MRCSGYANAVRSTVEKRRAGFMVKRMLDLGRLLYLKYELGLKATKGVQYCDCATESPESTLLISSRL